MNQDQHQDDKEESEDEASILIRNLERAFDQNANAAQPSGIEKSSRIAEIRAQYA